MAARRASEALEELGFAIPEALRQHRADPEEEVVAGFGVRLPPCGPLLTSAVLAGCFSPAAVADEQVVAWLGVGVGALLWTRQALTTAGEVVYEVALVGVALVGDASEAAAGVVSTAGAELEGLVAVAAAVVKALLVVMAVCAFAHAWQFAPPR